MHLCADLLVLQLADKANIASITYLARDDADAVQPGLDAGVALNHGAAEEILSQKPDLIVTGEYSNPTVDKLAAKAGIPIVRLKTANSFADIRAITRQAAAAVGEPARGEAMIAQMDRTLADLARTAPARPWRVAAWSGDSVPGRQTLSNAIIEAAGARNVAALQDNSNYNAFDVEQLLAARPEFLMYGRSDVAHPSLAGEATRHRALRQAYAGRALVYPENLYNCGLPQSARAAAELRQALTKMAGPK